MESRVKVPLVSLPRVVSRYSWAYWWAVGTLVRWCLLGNVSVSAFMLVRFLGLDGVLGCGMVWYHLNGKDERCAVRVMA